MSWGRRPPGEGGGELWLRVGLGGARLFLNPHPLPLPHFSNWEGRGERCLVPPTVKSKCEQLVSGLEVKY